MIGAGAFSFSDVEGDPLTSVTITGLTLNGGTLTHTGGTVAGDQRHDGDQWRNWRTSPLPRRLNDATNSSFTYTVNDAGLGVTSRSVMNITVNAVNDVPVATGNTVIATEDVPSRLIGAGALVSFRRCGTATPWPR